MVTDHDIRLLAISPHVGNYAKEVLAAQGVEVRRAEAREVCIPGPWYQPAPMLSVHWVFPTSPGLACLQRSGSRLGVLPRARASPLARCQA